MNCWVALRTPHGDLEELGPVFTNQNKGQEWCNNKNKEQGYEDSPTYSWDLTETTLEAKGQ